MTDIEQKIRDRAYRSPSRARAAVSRSSLSKKEQVRMATLIDRWESEGVVDHVVAGEPEPAAPEVEVVEPEASHEPDDSNGRAKHLPVHVPTLRLNLNAAIRARLTPAGVAGLYAARHKVNVPDDLIERGCVWETQLWEFMVVFGPNFSLELDDVPTVENVVEVLDPRAR